MAFYFGQKVVCVDDNLYSCTPSIRHLPIKGETVTFGGYAHSRRTCFIQECGVGGDNPAMLVGRFRPIVERKTDTGMAILKKIAADASKKRERTDAR